MGSENTLDRLRADLAAAVVAILKYGAGEADDRTEALELLRLNEIEELDPAIRALALDKDELARATAMELVADLRLNRMSDVLIEGLTDVDSLVRQCGAVSIGENAAGECLGALRHVLAVEADSEVRQKVYYALWRLGDTASAFRFLEGLFAEHYRTRCFTANLLHDFVTDDNREFFVKLVRWALEREDSAAAASSMADFLGTFEKPGD